MKMLVIAWASMIAAAPAVAASAPNTPPEKTAAFQKRCSAGESRWAPYDCGCLARAFEAKRRSQPDLYDTEIQNVIRKEAGLQCLSPRNVGLRAEKSCRKTIVHDNQQAVAQGRKPENADRLCPCIGSNAAAALPKAAKTAANAVIAEDMANLAARRICRGAKATR